MRMLKITALSALAGIVGCSEIDDDHFPHEMTGINSWLYDSAAKKEYLVGFTEAGHRNRSSALQACAAQASAAAAARNLEEWSYVCCTATEKSQCATKVR